MTECNQQTFGFQALGKRKVDTNLQGGNLSADGGVILLREVDQQTGMSDRLAKCFSDMREQRWVEHSVGELLRQRIFGMAMGVVSRTGYKNGL